MGSSIFNPRPPRTLWQTSVEDRSAYLDGKINAAAGLGPEVSHPLDVAPVPIAADLRKGASRRLALIERNLQEQHERLMKVRR
jgi:hypothetical protein